MPGPMSIPNGSSEIIKLHDQDGKPHYRSIAQLTGLERAHLAARKRLRTGKTNRKEPPMSHT